VYCDGSVSNSILTDVFTSRTGEQYVGRVMVLVPAHDIGLITQTRGAMITPRRTPASTEAETFAIRTALNLCHSRAFAGHTIYSDCRGAVEQFPEHPVEWRSRQELRLPNDFFDKVLRRAAYLRSSSGKVARRKPATPHQVEALSCSTLLVGSSASARARSGRGSVGMLRPIQEHLAPDLDVVELEVVRNEGSSTVPHNAGSGPSGCRCDQDRPGSAAAERLSLARVEVIGLSAGQPCTERRQPTSSVTMTDRVWGQRRSCRGQRRRDGIPKRIKCSKRRG
jgi:hypothetical protein